MNRDRSSSPVTPVAPLVELDATELESCCGGYYGMTVGDIPYWELAPASYYPQTGDGDGGSPGIGSGDGGGGGGVGDGGSGGTSDGSGCGVGASCA